MALGRDGSLLVTRWKTLEALDPDTGQVRWRVPASPAPEAGPAVAPDGTIYVACHDGRLLARRPDGSEKWTCRVEGSLATTPVLGPDGTVVVRDMDRRLWAFTPEGRLAWSQEMPVPGSMGAAILTAPAVAPDGTVYAGNNDSSLTALHFRGLGSRPEGPAAPAAIIEKQDEWIIVGGVKLPVRP